MSILPSSGSSSLASSSHDLPSTSSNLFPRLQPFPPPLPDRLPPAEKLTYKIHSCSSYSNTYHPNNILVNRPNDERSRWTGATNGAVSGFQGIGGGAGTPKGSTGSKAGNGDDILVANTSRTSSGGPMKEKQWLVLKLERTSLVTSITFGKYGRSHPCNVAEMKIYGSLSPPTIAPSPSQSQQRSGASSTGSSTPRQTWPAAVSAGAANDPGLGLGNGVTDLPSRTDKGEGKWSLLFWGGLQNNTVQETFDLRVRNEEGIVLPCRYIKIEPIMAHNQQYNMSIWYVELHGNTDPELVDNVYQNYSNYRETKSIKLILKHLRQRNLMHAFNILQANTSLSIENPLITAIHTALILQGDFDQTETLLTRAGFELSLFNQYSEATPPRLMWKRLDSSRSISSPPAASPSPRGGHQMVLDSTTGNIWLFGGWNGSQELSDLWCWSTVQEKWELIMNDTRRKGGPGPRSCHKMAIDEKEGWIYVLGRFVDTSSAQAAAARAKSGTQAGAASSTTSGPTSTSSLPRDDAMDTSDDTSTTAPVESGSEDFSNDFYRFKCSGRDKGRWELIQADTAACGGPRLIFDHQMLVDPETETLYVFGGRIVEPPDPEEEKRKNRYSGLYRFEIADRKWTMVNEDSDPYGANQTTRLCSRVGHSMLLDPIKRSLYIFAGERHDIYLSDLWSFSLPDGGIKLINSNYTDEGGPEAGFCQRATIDPELREWYMLSGLMKESKPPHTQTVKNSFWIRNIDKEAWVKVEACEPTSSRRRNGKEVEAVETEPRPRFAHQMVYDPNSKQFYVFGGNPADGDNSTRLGDFWQLSLLRQPPGEILRRAKFLVRKQKFVEMSLKRPSLEALLYLQNELSSVVNHADEAESKAFRSCMSTLLSAGAGGSIGGGGPFSAFGPPPGGSESVPGADDEEMQAIQEEEGGEGGDRRGHPREDVDDEDDVNSDAEALLATSRDFSTAPRWPNKSSFAHIQHQHHARHSSSSSSLGSLARAGGGVVGPDKRTYEQRTRVFEALLEFFPKDERQVDDELIDGVRWEGQG